MRTTEQAQADPEVAEAATQVQEVSLLDKIIPRRASGRAGASSECVGHAN
jgi:hypothetical protein